MIQQVINVQGQCFEMKVNDKPPVVDVRIHLPQASSQIPLFLTSSSCMTVAVISLDTQSVVRSELGLFLIRIQWSVSQPLITSKSDQFQFPCSFARNNTTQYIELGFSWLIQVKDDYTTNSHYLICFSLKVGRMYYLNFGDLVGWEESSYHTGIVYHLWEYLLVEKLYSAWPLLFLQTEPDHDPSCCLLPASIESSWLEQ